MPLSARKLIRSRAKAKAAQSSESATPEPRSQTKLKTSSNKTKTLCFASDEAPKKKLLSDELSDLSVDEKSSFDSKTKTKKHKTKEPKSSVEGKSTASQKKSLSVKPKEAPSKKILPGKLSDLSEEEKSSVVSKPTKKFKKTSFVVKDQEKIKKASISIGKSSSSIVNQIDFNKKTVDEDLSDVSDDDELPFLNNTLKKIKKTQKCLRHLLLQLRICPYHLHLIHHQIHLLHLILHLILHLNLHLVHRLLLLKVPPKLRNL